MTLVSRRNLDLLLSRFGLLRNWILISLGSGGVNNLNCEVLDAGLEVQRAEEIILGRLEGQYFVCLLARILLLLWRMGV